MSTITNFANLTEVAQHFRKDLTGDHRPMKDLVLLFAHDASTVVFLRSIIVDDMEHTVGNIKISRGEETLFIWCFFLAICQLVIDKDPAYSWVKYIYIDDPVSSLDENNAIAVACDLCNLLTTEGNEVLFERALQLFSHGKYSIFDPVEMGDDNKELFKRIFNGFIGKYEFYFPQIFNEEIKTEAV